MTEADATARARRLGAPEIVARGPATLRRRHFEAGDRLEREVARTAIAASLFAGLSTPPTSVGRYSLRQRLGAGGMGVVFAAYDPSLKRELAIKLLHARHATPAADQLLLEEAQNTARLVHPAVVTIFDVGLHEGRVFIAMEQIAGQSMREWLRSRPPWRQSVAVLARAARGIEAAHARGIIHRDFKPANVLLGRDGRVCVADFGLARDVAASGSALDETLASSLEAAAGVTTYSGSVAGTPAYMAPEQYLGTIQDERTDQFALCASLYEALFGRTPFEARTIAEIREAILTAQPVIPPCDDVPEVLLAAVARGLSKDRRDRFASVSVLAELLESLSQGVDLSRLWSEASPPRSAPTRESAYDAYLRQLPDGLDTSPEQRLPSRIYQVILANRPLAAPPPVLARVISGLSAAPTVPAVHARAILSAVYDEHFASLDEWRAFVGEASLGVVKLLATSFTIPKPSSPYFIRGLAGTYNNHASGIRMEVEASQAWSAVLRLYHPPKTLNDVSLVAWEEVIRAVMLAAGCRLVELVTIEQAEDSFVLTAHWR